MTRTLLAMMAALSLLLASCTDPRLSSLNVQSRLISPGSECSGAFVAHDLPHLTADSVERIGFFISNGSGLAVNDLDNDGDLDLVLGNLFGPNQILWNQGGMQFTAETFFEGSSRAVLSLDLNADGWLDILVSTRNGDLRYWMNNAEAAGSGSRFTAARLNGIQAYIYAMDWADLDQDGDLDLVSGSYDASMEKIHGQAFYESTFAGVYYFENQGTTFAQNRLAGAAQALSLQIIDLNHDGRPDIQVGNDFDTRDAVWLAADSGWAPVDPFIVTSMSTMSFSSADVNNDGALEIFSADMHPYSDDPEIMEQWAPVMEAMSHDMVPGDPQQMVNVLQTEDESGAFSDQAAASGIAATGWSWSSQFGDLNQDGFVDLYVVNGMQALDNFSHLPNDTLIEENQVFENQAGHFTARAGWGLNSLRGGRSMTMADLDGDGDLDIIVNNLAEPAQLFENQLCEGHSLQVALRQPGSDNPFAIGAHLSLRTSAGTFQRSLRVTSGYLSGQPAEVHFGIPADANIEGLDITWPDGQQNSIDSLEANTYLDVERTD
jgi:hypothetical protein